MTARQLNTAILTPWVPNVKPAFYTIMQIFEFCGLWKLSRLLMEHDAYDNNT